MLTHLTGIAQIFQAAIVNVIYKLVAVSTSVVYIRWWNELEKGQHLVSMREIAFLILCGRSTDIVTPSTKISQICQAGIVSVICKMVPVSIYVVCMEI